MASIAPCRFSAGDQVSRHDAIPSMSVPALARARDLAKFSGGNVLWISTRAALMLHHRGQTSSLTSKLSRLLSFTILT